MFIPYADDAPTDGRFPFVTYTLIALNVWVFATLASSPNYVQTVMQWGFIPGEFNPSTLITCLFLHGDFFHLLGNMWFLYLFGDNVESRCGHFKFLSAYLLAGVAGDLSHFAFFSNSMVPTIGASGAVFGVMGMYLFFFPANRVKLVYWIFILIGTISVRAIWVIGIFALMEVLYSRMQTMGGVESGVGHLAHSGGFLCGAATATFYTAAGWVRSDGANLWSHLRGGARVRNSRYADENVIDAEYEVLPRRALETDGRAEILQSLHAGRIDEARRKWRRYAFDNQEGVLPVREQLEIALALDKHGERGIARDAYERLLASYPNQQPYAAEANLALAGMLLQEMKETGDRHETPLVERLLRRAAETHPLEPRRELATRWLEALQS